MKLTTDEINALVAINIVDATEITDSEPWEAWDESPAVRKIMVLPSGDREQLWSYATSADAVLPLAADAFNYFSWTPDPRVGRFIGYRKHGPCITIDAPTFPLACCLALLRSKGVEVG